MSPERVRDVVREGRLRRDLTQEQLAVRAGVTRNTVGRIEAGKAVQRANLAAVLRTLGIDDERTLLTQFFYSRLLGMGVAPAVAAVQAPELADEVLARSRSGNDGTRTA